MRYEFLEKKDMNPYYPYLFWVIVIKSKDRVEMMSKLKELLDKNMIKNKVFSDGLNVKVRLNREEDANMFRFLINVHQF